MIKRYFPLSYQPVFSFYLRVYTSSPSIPLSFYLIQSGAILFYVGSMGIVIVLTPLHY